MPHENQVIARIAHLGQPLAPWRTRITPAIVLAASTSILGAGLWLDASPKGFGTHEQLGLPMCGVLMNTGIPCVTCGVTTAMTHAAHGRLADAFYTQPAGLVAAIFTAIAGIVALYALVVGLPLGPLARWLWRPATVWSLAGVVLMSWVYKCFVIYTQGA